MVSLQGMVPNTGGGQEPKRDFVPLPNGRYLVEIVHEAMKKTKSGNGEYLQITFLIREGPFKKRCVWHNLNLRNPSARAMEFARQDLESICKAVGVNYPPQDTDALHGKELVLLVETVGDRSSAKAFYSAKPASATPARQDPRLQPAPRQQAKRLPTEPHYATDEDMQSLECVEPR